jgi:uncharacterized protein YaiL (DUF2058 family)
MSLRDSLLKVGLVSEKRVQEVNRELKGERKQAQASREAASVVKAREDAARKQEAAARKATALAEKAAREAAKEAAEMRRMVRNLLRSYRVPEREGRQLFFHKSADGKMCVRRMIPESWIGDLRTGVGAVAWDGDSPDRAEYVFIPGHIAARVLPIAPERILFWNEHPPPKDDPAEFPYDMGAIFEARGRVPDRWSGLR